MQLDNLTYDLFERQTDLFESQPFFFGGDLDFIINLSGGASDPDEESDDEESIGTQNQNSYDLFGN